MRLGNNSCWATTVCGQGQLLLNGGFCLATAFAAQQRCWATVNEAQRHLLENRRSSAYDNFRATADDARRQQLCNESCW